MWLSSSATTINGDVTGVVNIPASTTPRSGQRYNINGQPVDSEYKGIVIENGQKSLIK